MKRKILSDIFLLAFLLVVFSGKLQAGLFNFYKQIDSIQILYNENELRLPGESIGIGVKAYFKNGKVKKTWNIEEGIMPWFRFKVEVTGGTFLMGRIKINDRLMPSKGKYIRVLISPKKAEKLAKEILLPLNYEESVEIVPVSKMIKAPGFGFNFKVVSTFDNGQEREYFYKTSDDLTDEFILAVNGGYLRRDQYVFENDFRNLRNHTANLTAISKRNPDCVYSLDIQMDYKAEYRFTLWGDDGFSGASGSDGSDGSGGSDGGCGQNGTDGDDGGRGPDIGVWADSYFDDVLQTELLYVYVLNLWNNKEYRYLINPDGGALYVTSRGGHGGDGGRGGDGGDGGAGQTGATHTKVVHDTDSTTVTVTYQDPGGDGGNGGHGGNGGYGGNGGDGGDIFLYFTDDALDYQNIIYPDSDGGVSGSGGWSGNGGSGGSGGSGDPNGSSGSSGSSGSGGWSGSSGWGGSIFYDFTDEFVN